MSFLKELKKQVDEKGTEQTVAPDPTSDGATVSPVLAPDHYELFALRMRGVEKYLRVFASQAQKVGADANVSYAVGEWGELRDLIQAGHKVVTKGDGAEREIHLEFSCVGERPLQFWTNSRNDRNERQQYLDSHDLEYRIKDRDKTYFTFVVAPSVPVTLVFQIDPKRPVLRLTTINLEHLGRSIYTFEPERLDTRLLDELAKRVLGRPNEFEEMAGYRLPADVREHFQRAITARKLERDSEAGENRTGSFSGLLGSKARGDKQ